MSEMSQQLTVPARLVSWAEPFLSFLKGNDGLPTVKVVVAVLLLFTCMDLVDHFNFGEGWDGDQKLIALGIIAGTRVASVLVAEISSAIRSKQHSNGGRSDPDTTA
ncbi:MAG: hypothetical protein OXN18_09510 [Gemmatimonadota bacterium]|nr:hypothetical protein [Gemmatimonadota bacterium]